MNSKGIGLYQAPSETYGISELEKNELKHKYLCEEDNNVKRDYSDYRFLVPVGKARSFIKEFNKKHNPLNTDFDYESKLVEASNSLKSLVDSKLFVHNKATFKRRVVPPMIFLMNFIKYTATLK